MPTLFHAPRSRSSRILWLLEELGVPYDLRHVSIRYMDGSGDGPDPANPHPDRKVPALLDDGALVTESVAVAIHLADRFPDAGLAPAIGDPDRGAYLGWIAWTDNELGAAAFTKMAADDAAVPAWDAAVARLDAVFAAGPYLLGERFSAADVMLGGTLGWLRPLLPGHAGVEAYLTRLAERPAFARAWERDGIPMGAGE